MCLQTLGDAVRAGICRARNTRMASNGFAAISPHELSTVSGGGWEWPGNLFKSYRLKPLDPESQRKLDEAKAVVRAEQQRKLRCELFGGKACD